MRKRILLWLGIIAFLYVLLGTLCAIVSFPAYKIFGFTYEYQQLSLLGKFTYTANIFLFGLMIVENSLIWIIGLQSIVFLGHWAILYIIMTLIWKR